MKRLFVLILTMIPFLASGQETDYPDTAEEVARRFAVHYENGNDSTVLYVTYNGKHVNDMGETAEALEKELLPEELEKNRKNPSSVEDMVIIFSESDETYKQDTYYASYQSRNKPHKFALFLIDGRWKVDISYMWMGDWFDWMPGF